MTTKITATFNDGDESTVRTLTLPHDVSDRVGELIGLGLLCEQTVDCDAFNVEVHRERVVVGSRFDQTSWSPGMRVAHDEPIACRSGTVERVIMVAQPCPALDPVEYLLVNIDGGGQWLWPSSCFRPVDAAATRSSLDDAHAQARVDPGSSGEPPLFNFAEAVRLEVAAQQARSHADAAVHHASPMAALAVRRDALVHLTDISRDAGCDYVPRVGDTIEITYRGPHYFPPLGYRATVLELDDGRDHPVAIAWNGKMVWLKTSEFKRVSTVDEPAPVQPSKIASVSDFYINDVVKVVRAYDINIVGRQGRIILLRPQPEGVLVQFSTTEPDVWLSPDDIERIAETPERLTTDIIDYTVDVSSSCAWSTGGRGTIVELDDDEDKPAANLHVSPSIWSEPIIASDGTKTFTAPGVTCVEHPPGPGEEYPTWTFTADAPSEPILSDTLNTDAPAPEVSFKVGDLVEIVRHADDVTGVPPLGTRARITSIDDTRPYPIYLGSRGCVRSDEIKHVAEPFDLADGETLQVHLATEADALTNVAAPRSSGTKRIRIEFVGVPDDDESIVLEVDGMRTHPFGRRYQTLTELRDEAIKQLARIGVFAEPVEHFAVEVVARSVVDQSNTSVACARVDAPQPERTTTPASDNTKLHPHDLLRVTWPGNARAPVERRLSSLLAPQWAGARFERVSDEGYSILTGYDDRPYDGPKPDKPLPSDVLRDAMEMLSRVRRYPGQQTAYEIEALIDRCRAALEDA